MKCSRGKPKRQPHICKTNYLEMMDMNAQNGDRSRPVATAGLFLLLIGLLIAIFYAVMCRYDDSAHQLSDFAFVVLGVSLQLVGLGFIIWKNRDDPVYSAHSHDR